jgi:4-phospho-D-threonate 3-dehydrogenase / 4-phospho-D-erythronate 3-dehydrogenase
MSTDHREPVLAVTVGDPAGIGPEIVARTLLDPPSVEARGFAVGDAAAVRRALGALDVDAEITAVDEPPERPAEPGHIDVLDLGISGDDLAWGEVSEVAGRASIAAVETATRLALEGSVDAVVTAPINKEAIWAAGSQHLGHTEMLGELTGSDRYQTMFVVRDLKIFFTTRHMALREALDALSHEAIVHSIDEAWTALQVLGHERPRLAVAALNPHGGEGGKFGDEEIKHIIPACDEARASGKDVIGPVPADSVFHQGLRGRFDAVLSHFHDQGHIAAKTVDFEGAITVTMGLPIIRTSVDHGTAFDIAGTGRASHRGMVAAFEAAARFAPHAGAVRAAYPPR